VRTLGADKKVHTSRLEPPVVVGETAYTFAAMLPVDGRPTTVGSFRVHSYDAETGRVVFARGVQRSSYTIGDTPGNITQVVYDVATGGTAVDTSERDRIYSVYNPMARRGSMASERIIPGDVLLRNSGTRAALFDVVSTRAYAESGPVNYSPFEDRRTAYTENVGTGMQLVSDIPGATVDFDDEGPETGIAIWDGVSAPVVLERQFFNDDDFQFPDDAVIPLNGYYFNPLSREVRFANTQPPSTAYAAYWLVLPGDGADEVPTTTKCVLAGAAGYDVDGPDFDETIVLLTPGIVRLGSLSGRGVFIDTNSPVSAGYREGTGSYDATPFNLDSITGHPVAFRFWRTGGRLRIYADETLIFDVMGNVLPGGNVLSVWRGAAGSTRFNGPGSEPRPLRVFDSGRVLVQRTLSRELAPGATLTIPDGFTLTEVRNLGNDRVLTPGGPGRAGYTRAGDVLTFRREAENDLVRASLRNDSPPPPAPGLAFRTFDGQDNFAEIDAARLAETGLPWATTDPAKNRANWMDEAFVVPSFDHELAAGDEVVCMRGVGFAPGNATVRVYRDSTGDDETDWVEITDGFRFDPITGLVLFETFEHEGPVCLRFDVSKRYRGGHHAELYEELRTAWEHVETLYAYAGAVGGASIGFHGTYLQEFQPKAFEIRDMGDTTTTWWPIDFVWGLRMSGVHGVWLYDDLVPEYIVRKLGYFGSDNLWRDLSLRTPAPGPAVHFPNGDPAEGAIPTYSSHDLCVEDEGFETVGPFGNLVTGLRSFGSDYPGPEPEVNGPFALRVSSCDVGGVRFDPGSLITRLPRNSEIVAAYMPVKFSNIQSRSWRWDGLGRVYPGGSGAKYGYARIWVNDRNILWNEFGGYDSGRPVDWVADEYLDLVDGASVSLDIVAARYDSLRTYTFNNPDRGAETFLPRMRLMSGYGSIGFGGRTTVPKNEWVMVNVTRAFRTALRLNDSPWQQLHLVPSFGQPATETDPESLGAYLQGLCNEATVDVLDDSPNHWDLSGTASGQMALYENFEVGEPLVRYRVGGGTTYQRLLRGIVG
jgi:hypothetical protein